MGRLLAVQRSGRGVSRGRLARQGGDHRGGGQPSGRHDGQRRKRHVYYRGDAELICEDLPAQPAVISNGDFDDYWGYHLSPEHKRLYPEHGLQGQVTPRVTLSHSRRAAPCVTNAERSLPVSR